MRVFTSALILIMVGLTGCIVEAPRRPPPPLVEYDRRPPPPPVEYDRRPPPPDYDRRPPPPDYRGPRDY